MLLKNNLHATSQKVVAKSHFLFHVFDFDIDMAFDVDVDFDVNVNLNVVIHH